MVILLINKMEISKTNSMKRTANVGVILLMELNLLITYRHTVHAAKALRWRVDQLLKCLIKKISLSS